MSADLALTDAHVLTMNQAQPRAEAIAVKGNRILRVGSNIEIGKLIGKTTQVICLKGKTVLPGFIDTHIHVADFGRSLLWMVLDGVTSIKELQDYLKKRVENTPKGKWIMGRGWNQSCFKEKRLPTRFDLDAVSPENPIVLYHQSRQLCVVNSKALQLAGVTNQTSPPSGGVIDKATETAELTGILRENATNLIWAVIPEPSEEELAEAAGWACEKILEAGVTSVHWMVLSSIEFSIIRMLLAQNRLPIRVYLVIPANLLDNIASFRSHDSLTLKVGGAMISADGYLAAKTAALLQPYSDDTANNGKLLCTQTEMYSVATKILKMGLQLVIHAMGDRAVDVALATLEQVSTETPRKDRRNRIEQAAVLNKGLIERMKRQKVIVSVQPCVIASEFSVWSATEHLGSERNRWLYPLKALLKGGLRVVGGSDCPMEPLNPLLGIQMAVAREYFPEERITVDEALRIYTIDAAYSSSEESIKGSIKLGKIADFTVLSHNPLSMSPHTIKDIAIEMTIVGGQVVYSKH